MMTVAEIYIDIASYVRTKSKPKRELRREAPQLSFGFYVLTCLVIDAIGAILMRLVVNLE